MISDGDAHEEGLRLLDRGSGFGWVCPNCGTAATLREEDAVIQLICCDVTDAKDGEKHVLSSFIVCPNPACKRYTLSIAVYDTYRLNRAVYRRPQPALTRQLVPEPSVKPVAECVPAPLAADYREASLIRDLSPKASATLSRRCLQGMIRDFLGVNGRTLYDEIDQIRDRVDPMTWSAIDAVRKIGNLGAHMEADINVIVDVDPDEAQLLIGLLELLFKDWYVARAERQKHLGAIIAAGKRTDAAKAGKPAGGSPAAS